MCAYFAVGDEFSNTISGVRSKVIPCEICGRQRALEQVFLPAVLQFSPVSVIPPTLHANLHLHVALNQDKIGEVR